MEEQFEEGAGAEASARDASMQGLDLQQCAIGSHKQYREMGFHI